MSSNAMQAGLLKEDQLKEVTTVESESNKTSATHQRL